MVAVSKSVDRAVDRPELRLVVDSDDELLGRIADRDLCAFEALYRRYARPVFAMALSRLATAAGQKTRCRRRSPPCGARRRVTRPNAAPARRGCMR
jgi:hypothetical protein